MTRSEFAARVSEEIVAALPVALAPDGWFLAVDLAVDSDNVPVVMGNLNEEGHPHSNSPILPLPPSRC